MRLVAENLTSADPVLPVRWCLDRKDTDTLKEQGAQNIHVLFVIAYEDGYLEDRQLVPIDQMIAYLNFARPGKHTVFAKVVWCGVTARHLRNLKKALLERQSRRSYVADVLNFERDGFLSRITTNHDEVIPGLNDGTQLDVVVPREHFPPEPSEWVKRVVNWGHEYPAVDQCQFRRRKLGLVAKLPVFAVALVVISMVTTITRIGIAASLALCGMRNIMWNPIIHPLRDDNADIYRDVRDWNNWFRRAGNGKMRSDVFLLLHPIPYVIGLVAAAVVNVITGISYLHVLRDVGILYGVILVMAVAVILLFMGASWAKDQVKKYNRKEGFSKKPAKEVAPIAPEVIERRQREWQAFYDRLGETLACRPGLTASLSALPAERQTLRLRFLDLKAKVCRPYAAS